MLKEIHLKNFRSYKDKTIKFSPKVNLIIGPNGKGKTNLLEAILVSCEGKSYRAGDKDLIRFNQENARIELHTTMHEIRIVFFDTKALKIKSYKINNISYKKLSFQKRLPIVLFEPNNLNMLSGPADLRRQFLDDLLEKTTPSYGSLRRSYRRILAQRNNLLKKINLTKDQLFVWDVRLCELGEQIAKHRYYLSDKINEKIEKTYENLSGTKAKITLSYLPTVQIDGYGTILLNKLEEHLKEDLERGFTSYGPHREDISIIINDHQLQVSASRGEVRTMVLTCKIIEAVIIEETLGLKPILLFDDVFSELDKKRREQIIRFLQPYQSFITTTDADTVSNTTRPKQKNIYI